MRWRLIGWLVRVFVTVAVVSVVAAAWLFWRAMPVTSGTERLPGLSAEARVWRDGYGVPHVFAANKDDAARALGWLHASERLFQMEVNRRVGQGRAAETFGPDLLKVDKFIRTLGFYRAGRGELLRPVAGGAEAPSGLRRRSQCVPGRRTGTPCRRNSCSSA